ncbi:hypothetical protein FSP39_012434 [Pinctada imbricata]|uniref:Reverse transcriptase domain-containing protein n=1 Tax=Pinctada imbricata TaxID=66713 RepID=A0AA88YCM9_PINIB|nr:hypothetical protein FSP39_012434 [Pinctada imbricata]
MVCVEIVRIHKVVTGSHDSQIDYILSTQENLVEGKNMQSRHPNNTSTHDPVYGTILLDISLENVHRTLDRVENQFERVKWDKVDRGKYCAELSKNLLCSEISKDSTANDILSAIETAINTSIQSCNELKQVKGHKKPKLISNNVLLLSKKSKKIFWEIKNFQGGEGGLQRLKLESKLAKKNLRRAQRKEQAEARHLLYQEIMESESHNQRLFYKLTKKQRSGPQMKLSRLFVNDVHLNTEDEIREGWAGYFEELSRPKIIETFDVEYKEQVETDMKCIQQTCEAQQDRSKLDLTHEHILEVVTKLKNGKSADENNITAESIKFGGSVLIDYLQILFGKIVSEKEIPEPFKCGIITPIYKKNNKPLEDPNSYRRITVSSIIGKIFEKIHLDSMESLLTSQQNDLQSGFTKNTSPVYAGLILTEALAEAMDTKQTLYAGFLDASKAFDVVWHDSMLRKLYIQGLEGTDWLLLKNWYTGMRSKVKWGGGYSSAFLESQGVRQGGIWSPTAYKMFINPALDLYETYHLGFKIGSVHLGSPTCADDELLLSTKYQELRTMVNIQETYANRERYTLSEAKSKVMVFNKMARTKEDSGYIELNNKELEIVDSYTHIGIERHSKVKAGDKGEAAVMIARKTIYSLMGAGFHGYNGVNPKVSIKMWAMYVKPRMLYGLESQILKRKDIDAINHYHKKVIKQLMHLPQRTADATVYILAGDIPIEGDLHIKILGQLGNIFRSNGVERKLAERQLAMKEGNIDTRKIRPTINI